MNKRGRPRKALSVEVRYIEALSYTLDQPRISTESDSEVYEVPDEYTPPLDIKLDTIELERFIYFLPYEEVIVLLFRYMGYGTKEIMGLLGITSQRKYYELYFSIKTHYDLFRMLHKTDNY